MHGSIQTHLDEWSRIWLNMGNTQMLAALIDNLTREFVFIIQAALTLCRTPVPANSGFLLLIWQIGEDLIDTAAE
jgi:hypothetical protein